VTESRQFDHELNPGEWADRFLVVKLKQDEHRTIGLDGVQPKKGKAK